MKKFYAITAVLALSLGTLCCLAGEDCISEASGVLRQPVKSCKPFYLELDGTAQRLELEGAALKQVPLGARIKVRGTLRAELHKAQSELAAMPTHWHIFMAVRDVETLPVASEAK
jgi:hypothetical protein